MRLTLRTLLAWLDDTLTPVEVREIGQQVAESPFSQELVERIHRVTRRRRLTVPSGSGPEAVDPNLVASYLDNDLGPDQVTEYEKRCLTTDVILAEVASVHQILSLIRHKAKVPAEARNRMYRLVKGREAVRPLATATVAQKSKIALEPLTEPLSPWSPGDLPRRGFVERFGPAAAVIGLIGLLSWLALYNLKPTTPVPIAAGPAPPPLVAGRPDDFAKPQLKPPADPGDPAAPIVVAIPADPGSAVVDPAPDAPPTDPAPAPAPAPTPALPGNALGRVDKADGVLLRALPAARDWERLADGATLADGDRLVALAPFRPDLRLGEDTIRPVGGSELLVRPRGADGASHFELARGAVTVRGLGGAGSLVVHAGAPSIRLKAPAEVVIGIERGGPDDLVVSIAEGVVTVEADGSSKALRGPAVLRFHGPQTLEPIAGSALPSWLGDAEPEPALAEAGKVLAASFRARSSPVSALVESALDPQPLVQALAVEGLVALDQLDLVVPMLGEPGRPEARRAALNALQGALRRGPESAQRVDDLLVQTWGDEQAETLKLLIRGLPPESARDENVLGQLVKDLDSAEVVVRELSIDNLTRLTGRDRHGYDPDNPRGPGLEAWREALKSKRLRAGAGAAPAAATPPGRP